MNLTLPPIYSVGNSEDDDCLSLYLGGGEKLLVFSLDDDATQFLRVYTDGAYASYIISGRAELPEMLRGDVEGKALVTTGSKTPVEVTEALLKQWGCPGLAELDDFAKNGSVNTIIAYRLPSGWAFDDPRHGLVAEALIEGADTAIDKLLAYQGKSGAERVVIRFSDSPWPGVPYRAARCGRSNGGTDYVFGVEPLGNHRMWLCPALEHYFAVPPPALYMGVQAV